MNKRQVISSLNSIAEELDNQGLYAEANKITNVIKKIAQTKLNQGQANVSSNLANNLAFSYHSLKNMEELIMQIHMETRAKIDNEELTFACQELSAKIKGVYTRMILGNNTDTIPFNSTAYYKPKNLIELRNFVSSFYKKEVSKYSNISWMKEYISDLGSFTNKAVNALNDAILDKNPKRNQESSIEPSPE